MSERGHMTTEEQQCHVRPDVEDVPTRPVPALRRRTDFAPFEQPAFAGAVSAAWDHVVDHNYGERRLAEKRGEDPGEPDWDMSFSDAEALCRLFLVHFIALGGRL
jgi:hypothetical protein